jgi:hypothetical protein
MPITQDRLIALIDVCEHHYDRLRILTDQAIRIRHDLVKAISEHNDELAFTYLDQLMHEVQHATRIREAEYSVYRDEKKHFELNANHNNKSKALMQRYRQRLEARIPPDHSIPAASSYQDREDARQLLQHVQTQPKANEETEIPDKPILMQALELYARLDRHFKHDLHSPIPAEQLAQVINVSEGTMNQRIIPYLLSQGLLVKPDAAIHAYIPKRKMDE